VRLYCEHEQNLHGLFFPQNVCQLHKAHLHGGIFHGIYHSTPKVRPCQREIRWIFQSTMVYTMEYSMVYTMEYTTV
jgi:hypothetical protein